MPERRDKTTRSRLNLEEIFGTALNQLRQSIISDQNLEDIQQLGLFPALAAGGGRTAHSIGRAGQFIRENALEPGFNFLFRGQQEEPLFPGVDLNEADLQRGRLLSQALAGQIGPPPPVSDPSLIPPSIGAQGPQRRSLLQQTVGQVPELSGLVGSQSLLPIAQQARSNLLAGLEAGRPDKEAGEITQSDRLIGALGGAAQGAFSALRQPPTGTGLDAARVLLGAGAASLANVQELDREARHREERVAERVSEFAQRKALALAAFDQHNLQLRSNVIAQENANKVAEFNAEVQEFQLRQPELRPLGNGMLAVSYINEQGQRVIETIDADPLSKMLRALSYQATIAKNTAQDDAGLVLGTNDVLKFSDFLNLNNPAQRALATAMQGAQALAITELNSEGTRAGLVQAIADGDLGEDVQREYLQALETGTVTPFLIEIMTQMKMEEIFDDPTILNEVIQRFQSAPSTPTAAGLGLRLLTDDEKLQAVVGGLQ